MAYTDADILVRAVMQNTSGLPEDVYVNDFAFHYIAGGAPSDSELTDLGAAVDGFYNDDTLGGNAVKDYMGEAINRAATHELQYYRIDTPMGSPRFTENWLGPAAPATANSNLPTEVAGVVSFHADLTGVLEESGATRPRARRRGRIYVGPLTTDAITLTDDRPVLSAPFTACLRQGLVAMFDEAETAGFALSVWSRADVLLRTAVGGWSDNAPDTQRRRGQAATIRTTFGPL